MAKKKSKLGRRVQVNGRSRGNNRHVRFHLWMMTSEAFRSLKPHEVRILLELYSLFNGNNNGYLFLSLREAARRCRMGKGTASQCFKTLIDRGFIRRRASEPENFMLREARYWILTEFDFGVRPATKDFMTWAHRN